MCIEVYAIAAEPDKVSARRLSEVSGLRVRKRDRPFADSLHFSRESGCSCSLLGDDADWGAATWEFVPEVLDGIAKALETLHSEAKGFTFRAIWMGDEPKTEAHVQLKDVLRDVRANKIKNKHVYKVGRAG